MCSDIIILAGGSGERLWPASGPDKPKQFMKPSGEDSFLQSAILRASVLEISGDICIITRKNWTNLVINEVQELAERIKKPELISKIIIMSEPCGRNTAPAAAWASKYLLYKNNSIEPVNILMMASDHLISPLEVFARDVRTASWYAGQKNIVSFAIEPAAPETGYGYIKAGETLPLPFSGSSQAFVIDFFREKPDAATAQSYLAEGNYYWNSGIYAFRADFYLNELELYSPEIYQAFQDIDMYNSIETIAGIRIMSPNDSIEKAYKTTPPISIDYAVSEKTERAVSVRAGFLWNDIGTWDSFAEYYSALSDTSASIKSENCFVYSDIPVMLCGVSDIDVIIKNGKALVAKKGETNLVKEALPLLDRKDKT
ncbi:mannose-1-phosphate guanylyltransferase [Brucepastera parasyntrophica]|uniref:mannose-1-phosphate guanylyltransferase n=1 Tax=Brucepastera parasyntrophica TaxID=2880008 RepID=UPI00210C7E2B|nr:sugar phosphate nucleotidyltransferase [Brucepastera parasyntrophica]ULQ60037.1 mannose-1-phosphate guanylyltransferase [Brucepastera parasyntrophica]